MSLFKGNKKRQNESVFTNLYVNIFRHQVNFTEKIDEWDDESYSMQFCREIGWILRCTEFFGVRCANALRSDKRIRN